VRLLRPIRSYAHRFGGSHAQRDVLDLTLIEAARRAGQKALAAALETERASTPRLPFEQVAVGGGPGSRRSARALAFDPMQ